MYIKYEQQVLMAIFLMLAGVILLNTGLDKAWRQSKMRKAQLQEQRDQILGHTPHRMERYITREKELVNTTKTDIKTYMALMVASVLGGWVCGKLIFMDTVLSMCLAGICIVLPHAFLLIKSNRDKRELADNLEAAMRTITHEYIATMDIEKAVEKSVDVIIHDKPFREFLVDCKMVSSNIERNLRRLETKEDNMFFSRWIDQLILVQSDREQIVNLTPILDDMNDAKTAQRENDTKVASAWSEYFTMLFIILLSPLMVRFVQYEWYLYLVTTLVGKLLVMALMGALVWATGQALKINKPITG